MRVVPALFLHDANGSFKLSVTIWKLIEKQREMILMYISVNRRSVLVPDHEMKRGRARQSLSIVRN